VAVKCKWCVEVFFKPEISPDSVFEQDRQCAYKVAFGRVRVTHSCCGKAVGITYTQCVSVALGMEHATRMYRVMLSSVACLGLPYFLKSHECPNFVGGKKSYKQKVFLNLIGAIPLCYINLIL
jgi:hypothetical protein